MMNGDPLAAIGESFRMAQEKMQALAAYLASMEVDESQHTIGDPPLASPVARNENPKRKPWESPRWHPKGRRR